MTAGIEGGSRRTIEGEWTWGDWTEISESWERTAPPVHYTAYMLARGFGAAPERSSRAPEVNTAGMPSIAEMVMTARPLAV